MRGHNVAYQISEETKNLAVKCPSNFACTTNHKWDTCSIERDLPVTFLVIDTKKNNNSCPYCFSYAGSYYCSCPVRLEIYRSDNI